MKHVKEAFVGYGKPAIAVDTVILRVKDLVVPSNKRIARKELQVLLTKDKETGRWKLPGGIMHLEDTPADVIDRIVKNKAGVQNAYFEQLYTQADDLFRDPRGRVISMVYIGIVSESESGDIELDNEDIESGWFWVFKSKDSLVLDSEKDGLVLDSLDYDHFSMVDDALTRLRGKLMYTDIGFRFANEKFTLQELERTFTAVNNKPIPGFRRIISPKVEPTGEMVHGKAFRPAELYCRKSVENKTKEE